MKYGYFKDKEGKDIYIDDTHILHNGKRLVDVIYPIGAIYISVNSTNPAILFGGTWEQIKGRFLIGTGEVEANTTDFWGSTSAGETSFTAGEMGGEYYHTLSYDEMPKHTHDIRTNSTAGGAGWTIQDHQSNDQPESLAWHWGGIYISYAGESQRHNNMPPYLAVYMWKRIS